MIGYLKGILTHIENNSCIVDVGGVGYLVYCSVSTLAQLREKYSGDTPAVKLFTRLIHREDVLDLYGFLYKDEYTLFNMLLTVSGIGPKQALKILGMSSISQIVTAVVSGDSKFLRTLSGIGEKKAQQIILELKEKLKKSFDVSESEVSSNYPEAVTALESLGFTKSESSEAARKVLSEHGDNTSVTEIVENALKYLSD